MTALATVAALERRLGVETGSLEDADLIRAEDALDDASALVRAEANLTWLDPDTDEVTAPAEVVVVVVWCALRVYRNPEGLASEALGSGAYASSLSPTAQAAYLTDDEVAIVRRAARRSQGTGGAYSVGVPSAYTRTVYETDGLVTLE